MNIKNLSLIFSSTLLVSLQANAQLAINTDLKSGKEVYETVCTACHQTGVAHAPKFADEKAWAPLIAEGQDVLTAHAWVGVRAMPARGGDPELKLVEFARAVAYIASNSGGNWQDPDVKMMRKIIKQAEERLEKSISEAKKMKHDLKNLLKK